MKVYEVLVNKKAHHVKVVKKDEGMFSADVNGKNVEVKMMISNNGKRVFLEVNGKTVQAEVVNASGNAWHVRIGGKTFEVQYPTASFKTETAKFELSAVASPKRPTASLVFVKDAVLAPIAGRIVALKVKVGQGISRGDCICVLEAMKMANEVAAPKDGVVKEIHVSEGAIVNKGDVLAVIA
ncbi:MAG: biotin/lipoyl-containing protein [Candidatus Bathyarchaeia archaeon]